MPSENEIITTFSLDLNGILQVTSIEKEGGKEMSITIENAVAQFEEKAMDEAKSRVSQLFDGKVIETLTNRAEQQSKAPIGTDRKSGGFDETLPYLPWPD